MPSTLKVIAATLVAVGVVVNLISLLRAPHAILLESSPKEWPSLRWIGWAVTSTAAVSYILIDYLEA